MLQKKYKVYGFFLMVLLAYCIYYIFYAPPSRNEQWMRDLEYVHDQLIEKHANVFHTISNEVYDQKFNDLIQQIPRLTDEQITIKLAQIVAKIGDSHTYLHVKESLKYPIEFNISGKEVYVEWVEAYNKEVLGLRLIAINGIPLQNINSKIETLVSAENNQWKALKAAQLLNQPKILRYFNFVNTDYVQYTLVDNNNHRRLLTLKAKESSEMAHISDVMEKKLLQFEKIHASIYESVYWYKYIESDKMLYFKYDECIDSEVAKDYRMIDYNQYPSFQNFTDKMMGDINRFKPKKIVIDLRKNRGGAPRLMRNWISRYKHSIADYPKIQLYVLIGTETYSSGVMACLDLKEETNSIFIGQPTGGNVNAYANVKRIQLPYARNYCYFSTQYYQLNDYYDEGFLPDVFIEEDIQQLFQMDKAFNYTKINNGD